MPPRSQTASKPPALISSRSSVLYAILALAGTASTALAGSYWTSKSVNSPMYKCMRPRLTPPNVVFPIVWTTLYTLLFLALWRALLLSRAGVSLLLVASFFLNVLWCYFYFGTTRITEAFVTIVALIGLAVGMIISAVRSKDYLLVALIAPYLAWISFAAILNFLSIQRAAPCRKKLL